MTRRTYAILYIVGWCRSGSTIVGNILNEVDDVFHAGELHYLWRNTMSLGSNTLCGCCADITKCSVWSTVVERIRGRQDWPTTVRQVIHEQSRCRTRHTRQILRSPGKRDRLKSYVDHYLDVCDAIADTTGCRLIIDGGKFASEAALLRSSGLVPVKILHLVRDPRSVAESWAKPKGYIGPMSASRSTFNWLGFNSAGERLARSFPGDVLKVRYEDFALSPAKTIEDVLRFVDIDPSSCPVHGRVVDLSANHTVTGNPDRLRQGPVTIQAATPPRPSGFDLRWLTASILSAPQRRRYGYAWKT